MTNKEAIEEFEKLLDLSDYLLGPNGCPWDREQTVISMRAAVLEEACEVIEAIDEGDNINLVEELGDLLYSFIFFCKLAEKEDRFATEDPIKGVREKLIFRHPHVFGDKKVFDSEGAIHQWEQIKKQEKSHRESLMDGIPKGLPALARAYKMAGKMSKAGFDCDECISSFETEEELGELLWEVIRGARQKKINPELALRKKILDLELEFRDWEKIEQKDIINT